MKTNCREDINSGYHKHDKTLFAKLFMYVKENFTFNYFAKYLADSAYDSTDIKEQLRECGITPAISRNGRRWSKSENPKDPEYGKRWTIERIFSRLKEVFGMAKNRFVGLKKVSIPSLFLPSCLCNKVRDVKVLILMGS